MPDELLKCLQAREGGHSTSKSKKELKHIVSVAYTQVLCYGYLSEVYYHCTVGNSLVYRYFPVAPPWYHLIHYWPIHSATNYLRLPSKTSPQVSARLTLKAWHFQNMINLVQSISSWPGSLSLYYSITFFVITQGLGCLFAKTLLADTTMGTNPRLPRPARWYR